MATGLENYPNIEPISADYPSGDIRNRDGATNGTPVNKLVYADVHQFFAKILRRAGITPNGLPENELNGFQYIEALDDDTGWISVSTYGSGATGTAFYRKVGRRVFLRGSVETTTTLAGWAFSWFILPLGFRPIGIAPQVSNVQQNNASGFVPIWTIINLSGSIGGANNSNLSNHAKIFLDGVSFFIS